MAGEVKKPRKPMGPRTIKDKVLYLLFKGQIEGDVEVVDNAGPDLVDRVMADRDLKMVKVVLQRKPRAPKPVSVAA